MRVIINISQLHSAALKRGVGFYALNLFKSLKELKDGNQYFLKKNKEEIQTLLDKGIAVQYKPD